MKKSVKKAKLRCVFLLILTLSLGMLCGCAKDTETAESSKRESSSSGIKLATGPIEDSSVVMRVGDTGVKYSEVRNYCYLLKRQYEDVYGDALWDFPLDGGSTIGEEAKQEIVNLITQIKVICATAAAQEVKLQSDEQDEALRMAEELMENVTEEDKKAYCLSVVNLERLYEENILAEKMYYIAADEADTDVSEQEAKQIDIAYLTVNKSADAAAQEEEKKLAEKLRKKAKKADDFAEYAREHTDAAEVTATIGKDCDTLDAEAVSAAFTLKTGQVSEVISGSGAYTVIYCVNDNNEQATYNRREEIINERCAAMFKEKYEQWLQDVDVDISEAFWEIFTLD